MSHAYTKRASWQLVPALISHAYANRAAGGWSLFISARVKLRLKVPKVVSPLINLHVVGRTSALTVESTVMPALQAIAHTASSRISTESKQAYLYYGWCKSALWF
jgi:hypothetical protein